MAGIFGVISWWYPYTDMASPTAPTAVNLGPLEAEVMRLVWREGLKTVAQVTGRVNEERQKPLDYNTILTVMSNLTKKKLLRRRRRGNAYHFSVTWGEDEFAYRQGAATAVGLLQRYGEPALAGFIDALAATPELQATLQARLGLESPKRRSGLIGEGE